MGKAIGRPSRFEIEIVFEAKCFANEAGVSIAFGRSIGSFIKSPKRIACAKLWAGFQIAIQILDDREFGNDRIFVVKKRKNPVNSLENTGF